MNKTQNEITDCLHEHYQEFCIKCGVIIYKNYVNIIITKNCRISLNLKDLNTHTKFIL